MLNETLKDLLLDLGLEENYNNPSLEMLLAGDSKYLRDLRMNVKGFWKSKDLSEKEAHLISAAIANNANNSCLEKAFSAKAEIAGATKAEIADAIACASLLTINNVMYRFRHFMGKESYEQMRAGLRMNIMLNPVLGKEFFELVSLCVSAVNGAIESRGLPIIPIIPTNINSPSAMDEIEITTPQNLLKISHIINKTKIPETRADNANS